MQTLVTWVIIGLAAVFVARWAYLRITGQALECCSDDKEASTCSCCTIADQCTVGDGQTSSPGNEGTGL